MNGSTAALPRGARFELRFHSLVDEHSSLAFPCDAAGHVDMDSLSEKALENYLYARMVVGCEFSRPVVSVSDAC